MNAFDTLNDEKQGIKKREMKQKRKSARDKKEFKIKKKDKGKEVNYFDKNRMCQFVNNLTLGTEKKGEEKSKDNTKTENLVSINQIVVPQIPSNAQEEDEEVTETPNVDYKALNNKLKLEDHLEGMVKGCIDQDKYAASKKYNEPQVVIVTPDCYFAIDLYKAFSNLNFSDTGYVVKPWKLFSKHMKPKEQYEVLNKELQGKKSKRLINVYIGTPNRLMKLLEMEGIKFTDSLKYMVLHCKRNKKNFTIFDIKDTRKDLVDFLKILKPHMDTHPDTKMMLCP